MQSYTTSNQVTDSDLFAQALVELSIEDRIQYFFSRIPKEEVLFTSSFGTSSVILLDLLYRLGIQVPVYFIDTNFHFPETLAYRDHLAEKYALEVINLKAPDWKSELAAKSKIWEKHPDLCCSIHKTEPMQAIKSEFAYWISGLMHWQSAYRKSLKVLEEKPKITKFYPLLDMDSDKVQDYIVRYKLPLHPLYKKGFESISCQQCTLQGKGRSGRWASQSKTECGLHTTS